MNNKCEKKAVTTFLKLVFTELMLILPIAPKFHLTLSLINDLKNRSFCKLQQFLKKGS